MPIKDITRMYAGQKNCGPVALHIATGLNYQVIIDSWPGEWEGVSNDRGLLGLPNDMPCDHYELLNDMNIPYRNITTSDVLNGLAKPEKTVLLIHLVSLPKNFFQRIINYVKGLFCQHWVVFVGYSPEGDRYFIDWGYNKNIGGDNWVPDLRSFTRAELQNKLNASWPRCAYVVGEGSDKQSWIKKIIARFI